VLTGSSIDWFLLAAQNHTGSPVRQVLSSNCRSSERQKSASEALDAPAATQFTLGICGAQESAAANALPVA